MATRSKTFRKKISIKDKVFPFDPTEPVKLIAYGYKKDKKHGIFTTAQAVDEIAIILCEHRSDDEIITIKYKDGQKESHDGSDCRLMDFDVYSELFTTQKEIDEFIEDHLYKES